MNTENIEWIAADWGTSNLRCWALSAANEVLFRSESQQGMKAITSSHGDFESALLEQIAPWLNSAKRIPVEACGMVGAKQGWAEAPYASVPCSPVTEKIPVPTRNADFEMFIHAGAKQLFPADVMRGEETQIAGLLSKTPNFEGLVCLPGTHTKWATISEGLIQSFNTYLTGELFTLLAEQSILRLTLSPDGWNKTAFLEAFQFAYSSQDSLLSHCFSLRAEALLKNLEGIKARSRLSGYLIGEELSCALANVESESTITLIGSDSLVATYREAIESLDIRTETLSNETAILAGLAKGRA